MLMHNLIEYIDNFSKTSGSLWQYSKDIPAVNSDGDNFEFDEANATDSFNRQVVNLRKAFANYLSTDIMLSETQLPKMVESGGFVGIILGSLQKTELP